MPVNKWLLDELEYDWECAYEKNRNEEKSNKISITLSCSFYTNLSLDHLDHISLRHLLPICKL